MPVFEQLLLLAILQCQHHSGSPPSPRMQLYGSEARGGSKLGRPPGQEWGVIARPLHGQYIFQIINRCVSNETPLASWTSPATATDRTTGRDKRELLIKATSLETRTNPLQAIFICLITKWGFSEETSGGAQQSQVPLARVVSFVCPGVNESYQATATLFNLNLLLIRRLTRGLFSMLSCTCASMKSGSALWLKW